MIERDDFLVHFANRKTRINDRDDFGTFPEMKTRMNKRDDFYTFC